MTFVGEVKKNRVVVSSVQKDIEKGDEIGTL